MENYSNLGGKSGVSKYESGDNYIRVQFSDGAIYLYDFSRPGALHVNRMKELATMGQGLNSYINRQVRSNFARKER